MRFLFASLPAALLLVSGGTTSAPAAARTGAESRAVLALVAQFPEGECAS